MGETTETEAALARARTGDEGAFRELTEDHRRELQVHCYRIVGSIQDAEDLVQETLVAAWRGLDAFEGRASVRSWLYRIATNRCLNFLRDRSRRPKEVATVSDALEPTRLIEPVWLDPYPDVLLDGIPDSAPGPAARYEAREAVGLAFITALQTLPPSQRVALVLCDVLGYRLAEAAEMVGAGETSVKGQLQRARASLSKRLPEPEREGAPLPGSAVERRLVGRFADAVESGDVGEMIALLTDDALLTMPPLPLEYQGRAAIGAFLRHREELRGRPMRVVPTRANSQPAFGCYLPDENAAIARARALFVLTLEGNRASAITWFGDKSVFPYFGLPRTLRD
jgi:RNA polymerase sigma-70 factor, ECF subfamily